MVVSFSPWFIAWF